MLPGIAVGIAVVVVGAEVIGSNISSSSGSRSQQQVCVCVHIAERGVHVFLWGVSLFWGPVSGAVSELNAER